MGSSTGIEWRPVPGWDAYRVSSCGRVQSRWKPVYRGHDISNRWKELKPYIDSKGYPAVNVCDGASRRRLHVHVMILLAFVGPRPGGHEGCHNDGNPINCTLSNLRWGTRSENSADRKRHGTDCSGSKHPNAKMTERLVRDIRSRVASGESQVKVANGLGVTVQCVNAIVRKRSWRHVT